MTIGKNRDREGEGVMNYETELSFLCEILRKNHIKVKILSGEEELSDALYSGLRDFSRVVIDGEIKTGAYFGKIEPMTKYKFRDRLKLCYIYMLLPGSDDGILFIGPYLSALPREEELFEIGEFLGVKPAAQKYLEEFYLSIPVLNDDDRVFSVIDTFCELIFKSHSFGVVEVDRQNSTSASLISDISKSEDFDGVLAGVSVMETRYSFENELMRAVSLGQQHKEKLLLSAFNERMFERRVADPVRNAKNYGIIMNTLLRKAAEEGGVHPVYIDKLSSAFALKIEQISDVKESPSLMKEMFSSYCRLVYKHSMKNLSPTVQKTVIVIDNDLSADLSLSTLAAYHGISPGYLATVFKKETGKTVSKYVRERRMKHAMHLLSTTKLQIQTVALHCGILDVQYFSKIFKAETGKTPKEYREGSISSKIQK